LTDHDLSLHTVVADAAKSAASEFHSSGFFRHVSYCGGRSRFGFHPAVFYIGNLKAVLLDPYY
jgi:hypothetical protein